ncbi:GvpL/GvpF family gas vesicle protein [Yinghuangia aomiensis]
MATYVYAIIPADDDLPDVSGIGDPPAPLRRIARGPVAAVAGDAPPDLRARRRDVAAHHEVLSTLADRGPVLPLRFGAVLDDDAQVADHLEEQGTRYAEALERLAGTAEFNVKAEFDLDTVLRDIVAADDGILAQRERARKSGVLDDQMRLGELVSNAVARRETEVRDLLLHRLADQAIDMQTGPEVENVAANLSFLVERANADSFRSAVQALEGNVGDGVWLRCTGPLPVYSFAPDAVPDAVGGT